MQTRLKFILSISLAILGGTAASAQILFDNGVGPAQTFPSAYYSNTSGGFHNTGNIFSPTASGTADYVVFDGYFGIAPSVPPTGNDFQVTLSSSVGDTPGTLITASGITGLSQSVVGTVSGLFTVYQFSGYLDTSFDLSRGTDYYFAVTASNHDEFAFATNTTGSATSLFQYVDGAQAYDPFTGALSFQLSNAPEPSTYAMMLVGIVFAGVCLRRRISF